jgi:hypothetical protein
VEGMATFQSNKLLKRREASATSQQNSRKILL